MKITALIRKYLLRRRQAADLLAMDSRMLNDIGLSRTDAEYHAGRFSREKQSENIWKAPNEK